MATTEGLDPQFGAAINAMVAASHGQLYIVSGYRSEQEQAGLYANAVKKYGAAGAGKWVAAPGHSNHNKGLAVDLGGDLDVAHQLAPQFGLVFPMSWEPWHVEPVHARDGASTQAYTQGPTGTVNPAEDTSLAQTPEFLAAHLANALTQGSSLDATLRGEFIGGGPQPAATDGGQGTQQGTVPTGKGKISPQQLYAALKASGMSPKDAAVFVAIAGRESGYDTGAYNGNRQTGDDSHGLFQINLLNGGWTNFLQQHGIANPAQDLHTLEGSVKAAKAIHDASGFHPWGGYKGMSWANGTNLQGAVDASGGEVSLADLQSLTGSN